MSNFFDKHIDFFPLRKSCTYVLLLAINFYNTILVVMMSNGIVMWVSVATELKLNVLSNGVKSSWLT